MQSYACAPTFAVQILPRCCANKPAKLWLQSMYDIQHVGMQNLMYLVIAHFISNNIGGYTIADTAV